MKVFDIKCEIVSLMCSIFFLKISPSQVQIIIIHYWKENSEIIRVWNLENDSEEQFLLGKTAYLKAFKDSLQYNYTSCRLSHVWVIFLECPDTS